MEERSKALYNGLYIKYVGAEQRGRRVFVGVMKDFRHTLIGHEIFY